MLTMKPKLVHHLKINLISLTSHGEGVGWIDIWYNPASELDKQTFISLVLTACPILLVSN